MSQAIAEILRQRVAGLSIVGKSAGLVRAITRNVGGKNKTFPVACTVQDPLACSESTVVDLIPDSRYESIVYFEDLGSSVIPHPAERLMGTKYRVRLRLVGWMDTTKIGDKCATGAQFVREIQEAVTVLKPYNLDPFKGLVHKVVGVLPQGPSIFGKYTYDEANRQYLNWPYDYFAIDIETTYILPPGCEEPIIPSDQGCYVTGGPVIGGPAQSNCKLVRACGTPEDGDVPIWDEESGTYIPGPQSGGGGIQSIVAGNNIQVDDTDPLNPIVSASTGGAPLWGAIGGLLSNQTDLQAALDLKANTSDLGSAAFTDSADYATAAQGALADTALQPGDVGSAAYADTTDFDPAGSAATAESNSNSYTDAAIAGLPAPVTTFTGLSDTPDDYVGDALKIVRVNAGATALEFGPVLGTAATANTGDFDPAGAAAAALTSANAYTDAELAAYVPPVPTWTEVLAEGRESGLGAPPLIQNGLGFERDGFESILGTLNQTAAREWLLPDKDGVIQLDSDVAQAVTDANNYTDAQIAAGNFATGGGTATGTNTGDQTITLTSDVTGSGTGSFATTIANNAVTNAKAADMAQSTLKGRAVGAGTGDPQDLGPNAVKTMLDLAGTNTGDQTITLQGDVTGSGTGTFTTTIAPGVIVDADINAAAAIADTKLATIATAGKVSNSATTGTSANTISTLVLRNGTDGGFAAGPIVTPSINTVGITGASTPALMVTGSASVSGSNTGDQTITLTGDVTGSGTGSFAATIANDSVTNAKAANMAAGTFKGRLTGTGSGDPVDLTTAQAKTELGLTGTNSGDQTTSGTTNRITVTNGATNPVVDIAATYVGQGTITTVGTLASGNATAIVDTASDTAQGKVELATSAETSTGTDSTRAVTPAGHQAFHAQVRIPTYSSGSQAFSSTTLATVAGTTMALTAGEWIVRYSITFTAAATTTGAKFALTQSTGAADEVTGIAVADTLTADGNAAYLAGSGVAKTMVSSQVVSPTSLGFVFVAIVNVTTAGNLVLQCASEVNASAITVTNISWGRATRIS